MYGGGGGGLGVWRRNPPLWDTITNPCPINSSSCSRQESSLCTAPGVGLMPWSIASPLFIKSASSRGRERLGIISKLNDAKKDEIISSLSQPPLPLKRLKKIHIWHHLLFGIKHKGVKGFKQNLWRDIHL